MKTEEHAAWKAMIKFSRNELLSAKEWKALSLLSLIDRTNLFFGPGNVRWATSDAERVDNLAFYQSL